MVGSSSSSTSGRANSTAASATRIRQPPENSAQARACAAASKPRPCRIAAARASAECASMSASRVWISAMRCASVAASSASAISAARSASAASTVSIRLSRLAGASCATPPIRARFGTSISPPSSASSPRISRKSVVLPVPLRPTKPTLCPAGITVEASSKSLLPSMEKPMFLNASMAPIWPAAGALSTEPPDGRPGVPPMVGGPAAAGPAGHSAAVIAGAGPPARGASLPLPSGSSWRCTEPSKCAPLSIAMVLWTMSPSQRAELEQAHLEAAQAADDAAVDHDLLGDHLALHRRALADDQDLGADVALDDALDLDVAARSDVAGDGEIRGEHRGGRLRLRRRRHRRGRPRLERPARKGRTRAAAAPGGCGAASFGLGLENILGGLQIGHRVHRLPVRPAPRSADASRYYARLNPYHLFARHAIPVVQACTRILFMVGIDGLEAELVLDAHDVAVAALRARPRSPRRRRWRRSACRAERRDRPPRASAARSRRPKALVKR